MHREDPRALRGQEAAIERGDRQPHEMDEVGGLGVAAVAEHVRQVLRGANPPGTAAIAVAEAGG